jgi:hypothetical protein
MVYNLSPSGTGVCPGSMLPAPIRTRRRQTGGVERRWEDSSRPVKPPSERPERQPDPERGPTPVRDIRHEAVRDAIHEADIIFGVDVKDRENVSLFYGESLLKRSVRTNKTVRARVLWFSLDFATDELEYLVAAVMTLKGSCCYTGEGDDNDPLQTPSVRDDVN